MEKSRTVGLPKAAAQQTFRFEFKISIAKSNKVGT